MADNYIINAISGEKDPSKAIKMLAEYVRNQNECLRKADADTKEILKDLRKVVQGNGDPSASLVALVQAHSRDMDYLKAGLETLTTALIGSPEDEKPGILDRVRDNGKVVSEYKKEEVLPRLKTIERTADNLRKLSWAVLLTVIGEITITIVRLL